MRLALCFAGLALFLGCAAENPNRLQETPMRSGVSSPSRQPEWVPPPGVEDPKDHAARVLAGSRCEEGGRPLQQTDPDEAWQWLESCVRAGRFTALRSVLEGGWEHLLRGRPEAPHLLAQIVAMRGGDVDKDLLLLHERRVPLFGLEQAMAHPELYRGRWLLVRARISGLSSRTVVLEQSRVVSGLRNVQLGPASHLVRSGAWASRSSFSRTRKRGFNTELGTGQQLVARLAADDPFLSPDDVVILLARFDGLGPVTHAAGNEETLPLVTLLGYYHPSPALTY